MEERGMEVNPPLNRLLGALWAPFYFGWGFSSSPVDRQGLGFGPRACLPRIGRASQPPRIDSGPPPLLAGLRPGALSLWVDSKVGCCVLLVKWVVLSQLRTRLIREMSVYFQRIFMECASCCLVTCCACFKVRMEVPHFPPPFPA